QTQVVDIMSFPIISVAPRCSVISAAKKMDGMHLHRLVVMADSQIDGIITQTDITRAIRTEFEKMRQKQQASNAELSNLIRNALEGLEQLQLFLNDTSGQTRPSATSRLLRSALRPNDNL
ncbi:MAG: CBS domain-containing protein, partial [Phycisphaerales bacterium]